MTITNAHHDATADADAVRATAADAAEGARAHADAQADAQAHTDADATADADDATTDVGARAEAGDTATDADTATTVDPVGAFAERVMGAVLGAQEVQAIYLGDRLGWYRALATAGALTSGELASITGSAERYAREWLEHQAATGYVTVDDVAAAAGERRYALPAAHAAVLTDEDGLAYMAPLPRLVAGTGRSIATIAEAYRTGGGVGWAELGEDAREAQAAANRPLFLHQLGQGLLPQAPEVHERLRSARRIADVGCGHGWSSIGLARAYPDATVDGFDVDAPSIAAATAEAAARGLADRARFTHTDAGVVTDEHDGTYDAVFAFECIHDMSDPVAVLARMRALVAEDGVVVIMDERTEERFTAPAPPLEQMLYGFSLMCCLPDGMAHDGAHGPSAATGTVMRPATLARYARRAGFATVEALPIEHDMFRFYRLAG